MTQVNVGKYTINDPYLPYIYPTFTYICPINDPWMIWVGEIPSLRSRRIQGAHLRNAPKSLGLGRQLTQLTPPMGCRHQPGGLAEVDALDSGNS